MNKPLEGLRVIEMGTLIAGPFCGRMLADFGAEVIKIEPPKEGDPLRVWGEAVKENRSLWWTAQARNKKCITLNLREKDGQELAKRLIGEADILIENFRPGRMEDWGLGYEELKKVNSGLIMVRISGFGQDGPYKDKVGFGSIGEAMGGLRHLTGYPDRPPTRVGISIGDSLASLFGALGAMMAVYHRDINGGSGQYIDVALYEAVFALMEGQLTEFYKTGAIKERTGTKLPKIAPSNAYDTKDGKYIIIGANNDNIFRRLCKLMGKPEMADNTKYATHLARGEVQDELDEMINDWTKGFTLSELDKMLNESSIPAGPIYSMKEISEDVHYQARDMLLDAVDEVWGEIKQPGIVPKLSETPGSVDWVGPALGEHNEEVYLKVAGLTEEEYSNFKVKGII
ncbi:MAG: CaiB/BaiF CoA transferase family protein [Bacillota bacterium]